MDETDRIIDECFDCRLCIDDCEFLARYVGKQEEPGVMWPFIRIKKTVAELAKELKAGDFREKPKIPYSCSNCGLCQELCPVELDIGKMCLELREELVKEGLGPLPRHSFVKRNQDFSASDAFTLAQPDPANDKCDRVFFPGCTLAGYSPSLVIKTYEYLRQKLPGTGIVLGCCGDQTLCLGDKARFQEVLEGVVGMFKQLGTSEVIVACPLCYRTLKEYAPELSLTFLSEVLVRVGLPEGTKAGGQTLSLHDSCAVRWEREIQDSVRALIKELGYEIEEMEYSREMTRCCGLGGMVPYIDEEFAGKLTKRRTEEASHDMVTYCASCRESFAPYRPAVHILDLIFNPDWERDKSEPQKTGKVRRENQAKVKTLIQEMSAKS